jgi:eukaryotic-like serine/threonine-protein kinase
MSYCHECGEKIALDDVYCPYCGIALQPPANGFDSASDSASADADTALEFEATQVDLSALTAASSSSLPNPEKRSETADDSSDAMIEEEVSLPPIPDNFERAGVQSSLSSDFPPPQSGQDTSEHIAFRTEEELSAAVNSHAAQNEETGAFSSSAQADEADFAMPSIGEAKSANFASSTPAAENSDRIDEPDFPPVPTISKTDDILVEQPSVGEVIGRDSAVEKYLREETPEPNFDATIPYSSGFSSQSPPPPPSSSPAEKESIESFRSFEDANRINPPGTPFHEQVVDEDLPATLISAPLPPVENKVWPQTDSPNPESKSSFAGAENPNETPDKKAFDAPQAKNADELKKAPSPLSDSSESSDSGFSGAAAATADSAERESRSYTKPNVNSVDTGGKKAKLKTLSEGTVLNGRYEIVRKIGGGGMGAVYLASDKNLGGILRAVKEMVQSYIEDSQQEKAVSDFKRESLLLSSLDHPAIPTIFDYFYDEKEGRFYLVMKYISGGDLAARLRSAPEGRIDEASVTEWAAQIADVLDYLHNRQPPIVYRDLKPSNIMIDANTGKVMLIDFGIARWVNKEEKGVTAVGTMGYAPPELFSGNVEPRSDIYSLGSTMFHLLTGADPQNNPLLIFDFHKHPRPRQINPQLSDQIEQILMRAVEYNAEKRFSSAAEMRDALQKHLENVKAGRLTFGLGDKSAVAVGGGGAAATALDPSQPVFCGFCGQKIVASDLFCPFCGAKQPLADAAAASGGGGAGAGFAAQKPAYVAPRMTARLYVISTGDLDAPVFNLEKDMSLIGRRDPISNIFPEVDLSKFDPQTKISRRHARIWREGDGFLVEDLGSSNGTLLVTKSSESVRLLPQQPRPLSHGDKLKLGDTTLHFMLG